MLRSLARPVRAASFALAVVLLAGCGDRNLVVDVDVLSYMDPQTTRIDFGPVPVIPGGLATGEVAVVKDVNVNMVEKPGDLAQVHSVSLTFAVTTYDSTGSGDDTLRVYMSDTGVDPLDTPPVAELVVSLTPGQTQTAEVTVDGDQRIVDLFDGSQMRVSLTNSLRGPAAGDPLNGRIMLSTIRAIVVANRQGT